MMELCQTGYWLPGKHPLNTRNEKCSHMKDPHQKATQSGIEVVYYHPSLVVITHTVLLMVADWFSFD